MSIIYALVGTNRALRHSNSNNQIVIGDFNSFRFFWDTLYIICLVGFNIIAQSNKKEVRFLHQNVFVYPTMY